MASIIVVRAFWDSEAQVWVAESTDLPGLVTEAVSLDALDKKLPGIIRDLLPDQSQDIEIPLEVIATYSSRIKVAASAA